MLNPTIAIHLLYHYLIVQPDLPSKKIISYKVCSWNSLEPHEDK